tara:strand:+ start:2522 stop:3232 length:711 start_codon:yes stop_codon:yes gene_type:complete
MDLHHLSASSLKTWKSCGLQFYANKVLGVTSESTHELTRVGSAVHHAFENASEDKDPHTHLETALNEQEVVTEEFRERAKEMTQTCIDWGWYDGIEDLDICKAEEEFLIDIGGGVMFKGFIDRLDIQGNTARIIDIKTQAKKFTADELRTNLQASIYNIAARKLYPNITGPIRVEFWVLRHEIQAVTKTEINSVKESFELSKQGKVIMDWDEKIFPPATSGAHCRWCPYIEECPEW